MRLLLLADPNSVHTFKWATSLAERDIQIMIFGLESCSIKDYQKFKNIKITTINKNVSKVEGTFGKINYLSSLPLLRKEIKSYKPDILHAHYATSYGLLGSLAGFSPFILSVWGSDVYSFPQKSFIHRAVLKYNLRRADKILSTSYAMALETNKYTTKEIEVTPFGIDLDKFKKKQVAGCFNEDDIVIGTVKTLDFRYGIEYLIRAFKIVVDKYPELPLKLLIVGDGRLSGELKKLVNKLDIKDLCIFTGSILYSEIQNYHNMIGISVFLSNFESFGVSVIEASACENPVVVSDIGGLPEVVENGVSGFIVPPQNPEKAAEKIEILISDEKLRHKMGRAGRSRVNRLFNWKDNVSQMIGIYNKIISPGNEKL